jgi:hypothetical protein
MRYIVAIRKIAFKQAYVANNHNATEAAITAGFSPKTAYSKGQRLLKNVEISGELAQAARKVGEIAGLTTERTLQETGRIAYADPGRLFRADGTLIPIIHELDARDAASATPVRLRCNPTVTWATSRPVASMASGYAFEDSATSVPISRNSSCFSGPWPGWLRKVPISISDILPPEARLGSCLMNTPAAES